MKQICATFTVLCAWYIFSFSRIRDVSCHQEHKRIRHARQHVKTFKPNSNDPKWQSLVRAESSPSLHEYLSNLERMQDPVSTCDGNSPVTTFALNNKGIGTSGGFGDRLLGMVTTYYLAIMKNSSFAVDWTRPYNLSDYFAVPTCNATHKTSKQLDDQIPVIAGADVGSRSSTSLPGPGAIIRTAVDDWKYFTDSLFLNDTGKDVQIITNSFHWKEVVQNEAFAKRAESLGLLGLSQAELFKQALEKLLGRPTDLVKKSFKSVMLQLAGGHKESSVDVPYVGVQIRLGGKNNGAVSGWEDPLRHSLEEVDCFVAKAVRLCRRMHINSIFVTADSEEAVRKFEDAVARKAAAARSSSSSSKALPTVVTVPGSIGHTDRSIVATEHAGDVWLKSILDWWVLKHASALIVSRSGFGETAALASDAEVALRLKLSSLDASVSLQAKESRGKCKFDDVFFNDEEISQRRL